MFPSMLPCKLCCLDYLSSVLPWTILFFPLWTMLLNSKGSAVQRERWPFHLHVVLQGRQTRQPTIKPHLC